jgi:hypothetical protein
MTVFAILGRIFLTAVSDLAIILNTSNFKLIHSLFELSLVNTKRRSGIEPVIRCDGKQGGRISSLFLVEVSCFQIGTLKFPAMLTMRL